MAGRSQRQSSAQEPDSTASRTRGAHGGSAAGSGISYQDRCAAWYAVQILSETAITPRWDLPATTYLTLVRCETGEPVDDILLGTSDEGFVFMQAKHTLTLSESPTSDLAAALDQCVGQYSRYSNSVPAAGMNPWQRALDPARDRLVIVASGRTSSSVRDDLRAVLKRVRTLVAGQPLAAAAVNGRQKHALGILLQHIRTSWKKEQGESPSDEQLKGFLSLLYVDTLDVDEGESDEERAIERLRSVILRDSAQGRLAWNHLLALCRQFTVDRSGADLRGLREHLSRQPLALRGTPSFAADIEALQRLTEANLTALETHTTIPMEGGLQLTVQRAPAAELIRQGDGGALAVIGEPGAGKTGVQIEAARALAAEGRDVVFLTADDLVPLSGAGAAAIGRLAHSLHQVLANWPGTTPAYLFIDALDSARSNPQIRQLVSQLQPLLRPDSRWRVIASGRLFDLAHSPALQDLFAGTPDVAPEYRSPAFPRVRHLLVPRLTDPELRQVLDQSPALAELAAQASPALRELLRNPFNLNIAAALLNRGTPGAQLASVRTQLELLDRYWDARILDPDDDSSTAGTTRERVLRTLCEQLVQSRQLSLPYWELIDLLRGGEDERALEVLLRQHLLLRRQSLDEAPGEQAGPDRVVRRDARTVDEITGGALLAFDHLILFDYAVARLLLRGQAPGALADRLAQERDLIITVGPSLTMHLHYLWNRQVTGTGALHLEFWQAVRAVMARPEIPAVSKVRGPTVAAELAQDVDDLESLLKALEATDESDRRTAEEIYRHLTDALDVVDRPLVGDDAGPWCALAERIASSPTLLRLQTALTTAALLAKLCEHPDQLTPAQLAAAGTAARHLLAFVERQPQRHPWLAQRALEAVCRTSASDPAAAEAHLRQVVTADRIAAYGYEEIPLIARHLDWLIPTVPDFVADLYRLAFGHEESSQETTALSSSRIFGLTSNRRQDYETGLYTLAREFPRFLRQQPQHAVTACLALVNQTVGKAHTTSNEVYTFTFAGREARLRQDASGIWDFGLRHEGEPLQLVDAFMAYLAELAAESARDALLGELLGLVAERAEVALVWRRLLRAGSAHPETLGLKLVELLEALPLLTASETSAEAGELLKRVYPLLDATARERLERVLLGLPDGAPAAHKSTVERTRNRLLGCLPEDVQLSETRALRDALKEGGPLPPNVTGPHFETTSEPYDEEAYLADHGVAIDAAPNRRLRELSAPVTAFVQQHQQSTPSAEDIAGAWPSMQALYAELERTQTTGADAQQQAYTWSHLLDACVQIARAPTLDCADDAAAFSRRVLLAASEHPNPRPNPARDANLQDSLGWGDLDLRVTGAQGLIFLARHGSCLDDAVREAMRRLADDPVASVRGQIARHLLALYQSDPELMWELAERFADRESVRPILHELVVRVLAHLAGPHTERTVPLVERIYDRMVESEGADHARSACAQIFADLTLWREHEASRLRLQQMVDSPVLHHAEVEHIIHSLRERLSLGRPAEERGSPTGEQEAERDTLEDEVRRRAHDVYRSIVARAADLAAALRTAHTGEAWEQWPEADRQQMVVLGKLLSTAAKEVYFASGAYAREQRAQGREPGANAVQLTEAQRRRFFDEMRDVFELLADIGEASIAHDLLQTLADYVDIDPTAVLRLIGQTIRAAVASGYHYEAMGMDLVVDVVERYLAEYRELFRESEEDRTLLLDLLDGFVAVGWPRARRLANRLDEIDR